MRFKVGDIVIWANSDTSDGYPAGVVVNIMIQPVNRDRVVVRWFGTDCEVHKIPSMLRLYCRD